MFATDAGVTVRSDGSGALRMAPSLAHNLH
jgi:hypothetical protein